MASPTNEATGSSSSSLPLSSTEHPNHYTYEVFLCFRGEDTRSNFTDHLHSALSEKGIETFIDDELRRGEEISSALVKAIEESRVSIIVFSQNYAASRWCLDELVKILECRKYKGQEVRSVFYKVSPSDVRHQRGAFGEAFATLDQYKYKDSMEKWKAALTEVADLSGWTFSDGEYEAKFIKKIIEELSTQVVNPSCELHVTEHPIGLESCREDVNRLLQFEENVVRVVGIWGPGGIGKTTIAKHVFNSIRHKFAYRCFLADVRSNSHDLAHLQEKFLSDILRDSTLKETNKLMGLQVPRLSSTIYLNAKSFLSMKILRYISMSEYNVYDCVSGDIDYLSNQLRWLDWPECPLQSFPSNFHANKLVELNIHDSRRITRLWEGRKNFSSLTRMDLRGCESLTEWELRWNPKLERVGSI